MKKLFVICLAVSAFFSCKRVETGFSQEEMRLINSADSIMRVLTIEDSLDLAVLRAVSRDFSADALMSEEFARLSELMVATVTHPSQDGVGIAGPQVGLNRRVVAVQRFDKEPVMNASGKMDHPFEVYPNIRIICLSDSTAYGAEGCLSVPDMRADVLRSTEVVVEYADLQQLKENRPRHLPHANSDNTQKTNTLRNTRSGSEAVPMKRDTVSGFTAVIFQHEIDHLEGILYIDRL
jgi:peptide deformylase